MIASHDNSMRAAFSEHVHDALSRLYDLAHLGSHPLVDILECEGQNALERSQELRRILLDAIRAVRPPAGVPAHSPDWRGYRILELRYIEGAVPREVMAELNIGRSQFFREQARALEAVTEVLWSYRRERHAEQERAAGTDDEAREDLLRTAVERVAERSQVEAIRGGQLLEELRPVIEPLARAEGVALTIDSCGGGVHLHVDRVLLRQAVLSLVAYGLQGARGGEAVIDCFAAERAHGLRLRVRSRAQAAEVSRATDEESGAWRELVAAMVAVVRMRHEGPVWEARLAWPTSKLVLLVVDDNADFLGLYRRYTTGHNWQIVGAASGAEAQQAIAELRPTLILLDVLMPGEDGWELLVALKDDEDTRHIPVVICSVLEQPTLAMTLGAAGYLRKPVQKQDLLRVLAPYERAMATAE
ncbi:MAG TPA: response regulator [Chloroflexi bacterium]|jgi:CheY-like chemotaxis protein|nr:response regulator [Chloroflexota bacterium]